MSVESSASKGTLGNGSAGEELEQKGRPATSLSLAFGRLSLNPNAEEFVPSTSRSVLTSKPNADTSKVHLERTNSSVSNTSDDEFRQYWRAQLPDDLISPLDFSIDDGSLEYQQPSNLLNYGGTTSNNGVLLHPGSNNQESPVRNGLNLTNGRNGNNAFEQEQTASVNQGHIQNAWTDGIHFDTENQAAFDEPGDLHPLNFLAAEFPNFAVESLSDIYYANGGDLSLTVEMLTQLELQDDGGPATRHSSSQPAVAPSLSPMDFPSLPTTGLMNDASSQGVDLRPVSVHRVARLNGAGGLGADFATVVRKTSQWPYERNGGVDLPLGAARLPLQTGVGMTTSRARMDPYPVRETPRIRQQPWLETGDAVATMYSDMREEARDHARVRNAFFEQARQAYLIGNKALAKELSVKGQWHNEQMKVAHSKAAEAIFRQRNASAFSQACRDNKIIDLHGLHVNEAIPLLRRELAALRSSGRTSYKRQQIFVCVGTGHHTKGSRTPARIPAAIERFLAEDEHLSFTEVQPGMLCVFV